VTPGLPEALADQLVLLKGPDAGKGVAHSLAQDLRPEQGGPSRDVRRTNGQNPGAAFGALPRVPEGGVPAILAGQARTPPPT